MAAIRHHPGTRGYGGPVVGLDAALTFVRRLSRDPREHRKPPSVLVRRGLQLMREQRRVVAHAELTARVPA